MMLPCAAARNTYMGAEKGAGDGTGHRGRCNGPTETGGKVFGMAFCAMDPLPVRSLNNSPSAWYGRREIKHVLVCVSK